MNKFNNIYTFCQNIEHDKKIPKELCKIITFTMYSKFERNLICNSKIGCIRQNNDNNDLEYIFLHKGKKYPFSVFSDLELQKIDQKYLKSSERTEKALFRTLKLSCSMDLINPRVTMGNSLVGILSSLILYQQNGTDKVIDYARNIIMNKDDYYELFNFKEINTLDKFDLYKIHFLVSKLNNYENIYEYLIFSKEIFNELEKIEKFKWLTDIYDTDGINKHNYLLFGNKCDSLFFQNEDVSSKNDKEIREIDRFTENPCKKTRHISIEKDNEKAEYEYKFKDKKIGLIRFDLFSKIIDDEEVKQKLLSKERYHECHKNANSILRTFTEEENVYVVGGKLKINENDYFYHSWVEVENKNIVIDFNHNIMINKDDYYKLYEIKPISKISTKEMKELVQTAIFDIGLNLHPMFLNYFGSEMMRDLDKNKKVFQKKTNQ